MNKGMNKSSSRIPVYMVHLPTIQVCTNFNLLGLTVLKRSVMKNEEMKGQISSSSLIPVYMIHLPTAHVYQVSIFKD